MAEAAPWTSSVICRYYLHGVCRAGGSCRYSHDLKEGRQASVCKFYLQGTCVYGDSCRYDHVKDVKNKSGNSYSQSQPSGAGARTTSQKAHKVPNMTVDTVTSKMTPLKKQEWSADSGLGEEFPASQACSPVLKDPEKWVKAAEFVPGKTWKMSFAPNSYCEAIQSGVEGLTIGSNNDPGGKGKDVHADAESKPDGDSRPDELCPFAAHGECRYGENCVYLHGNVCDLCGRAALMPGDDEQNRKHQEECIKQHEEDMELSFAIARSRDKTCGVCMELVLEKMPISERRFGILSNCTHVYCLSCIRKWRSAKQFENKIVRACPECRVKSDFVTPSKYWVEDKEEKEKLIGGYKVALSQKPCKYFKEGNGECPFNENCFYQHAYPDGKLASPKPRRRRQRQNDTGDLDFVQQILLWDFFEERSQRLALLEIDLEDFIDDIVFHSHLFDSSSDDSDFSDIVF